MDEKPSLKEAAAFSFAEKSLPTCEIWGKIKY